MPSFISSCLDSWKLRWREDEAKREHLIGVLQQLPTLAEAAGTLEFTPGELLGCLDRMGLAPSVASPGRVVEDDARVEALYDEMIMCFGFKDPCASEDSDSHRTT